MMRIDASETSEDIAGYRPVSRLAVAAAVVGAVSSLALTSSMLWVLPLVGVALAVAGLADVARPGAEKAGRLFALAGLALSIGFGSQAVTSAFTSRWIAMDRARATVRAWHEAIREGTFADARSMVAADMVTPDESIGPHGAHDHADASEAAFLKLPAVAALRECSAAGAPVVEELSPDATATSAWTAIVRVSPCADGRSVRIALQLQPNVVKERGSRIERWIIMKADVVR